MLIAPVEEERVSMVALQLADVLNVSITKLSRLLSGRPGPLTKAIPRETANKLAKAMEQLDIQIAVVPENLEEMLLFPQKETDAAPESNTSSESKQTKQEPPFKGGLQANELSEKNSFIPSQKLEQFAGDASSKGNESIDGSIETFETPAAHDASKQIPLMQTNVDDNVTPHHESTAARPIDTAAAAVFADTEVSFAEPAQRSFLRLFLMLLAFAILVLAVIFGANYVIPQARGAGSPVDALPASSSPSSNALSNLTSAAEAGDADAQFELAWAYANGLNTDQSYEEAARWLQFASDQGNAKAQYYLGLYYYFGHGLEQNPVAAFNWFRSSALQGVPEAQYMLGRMYLNGDGVSANQEEALKWLYLADEKGVTEAGLLISGSNDLASPNVQNHPLFEYAKQGNLEAIRTELNQGANLNMRDPFGQTPLMYAVSAGEVQSLRGLLDLGADINTQSDTGWTALMFAARENAQAINVLLSYEASADLVNNDGQKAYDIALVNHPEALISLQAASTN